MVSPFKNGDFLTNIEVCGKQYVISQDTNMIVNILFKSSNIYFNDKEIEEICDNYFRFIQNGIKVSTNKPVLINGLAETDMLEFIYNTSYNVINSGTVDALISLDRFIYEYLLLKGLENIYSFSVTRKLLGFEEDKAIFEQVPRIGNPSIVSQISNLATLLRGKKIAIIDDGLFSGATVKKLSEKLQSANIKPKLFVGYVASKPLEEIDLEPIEAGVVKFIFRDFFLWYDLRDLGIFGGHLINTSGDNSMGVSFPCFPPFRYNSGLSRYTNSKNDLGAFLIQASIKLIQELEDVSGTKLTFEHFVKAGYGIVGTPKNTELNAKTDERINDFLFRALDLI